MMSNEFIFLVHALLVIGCVLIALRLGELALSAWVVIQALLANLFVTKQIHLFGFDVTASDVYAIGCILGLNLLQEHFSKEKALQVSKICLFFMAFFAGASYIHLLYIPNAYDKAHPAFCAIFNQTPRIMIASIGVFFVVQYIDTHVFAWLKKHFHAARFLFRGTISLIISQCLDTLLFTYFGLFGIVESLFDIFVMSLCIKLIIIVFLTPTTLWATKKA